MPNATQVLHQREADDATTHFVDLERWLDHDLGRLRRILAAFHRATVRDLVALEHAAARNDWHHVRRLADRIAIGCATIGEAASADCLAPLREACHETTTRAMFFAWYAPRREALLSLLERAAERAVGEPPLSWDVA